MRTMNRQVGTDPESWFCRRTKSGRSPFLGYQCPVNASAGFSIRTLILRAYPVTFFTAFLTLSAAFCMACSAFPTV